MSQNDLPEHIKRTLEEFREDVSSKIADAKRALEAVNMLEAKYGLPLTSLVELNREPSTEGREVSGAPAVLGAAPRGAVKVRPDEYLGMTPLDAAKRYIAQIGHAVHLDELTDAVVRGGAVVKGGDWKEALGMSLTRSVADVLKVQDGTFGLTKFYSEEQIRRLRETRRQATLPKKSRARARKKKAVAGASKATAPEVKTRLPKPDTAAPLKATGPETNGEVVELAS